ncbi:NADPH-dependent FMN reductase [Halostella litorea]|uniref:NADPH-dependent FMN reductase n=1 Tax=Halostella litorea TaxID=2528831 RepID=UPI00109201B8|nr:NAD(P)H-dependent oxidoreductase [Halostella litorea]
MERDTHVVAICGSRRDESRTRVALRAALDAAAGTGATTELVDLREYDLPPLDPDAPTPADAEALARIVADADAVLLGTPNYHGSYAGHLKNALDHLGRDEFGGKLVGLLEVAGGSYPKPALAHLRAVCRTLNAWTHPLEVGIPNASSTVGTDGIDDDGVADRVRELGRELAEYAGVEEYPELAARQGSPIAGAPGE